MNEQEMTIFNRVTGFGVYKVEAVNGARRDQWVGTEVSIHVDSRTEALDFFFPDYAGMSDEEMAEVIANNLREELWRRVRS